MINYVSFFDELEKIAISQELLGRAVDKAHEKSKALQNRLDEIIHSKNQNVRSVIKHHGVLFDRKHLESIPKELHHPGVSDPLVQEAYDIAPKAYKASLQFDRLSKKYGDRRLVNFLKSLHGTKEKPKEPSAATGTSKVESVKQEAAPAPIKPPVKEPTHTGAAPKNVGRKVKKAPAHSAPAVASHSTPAAVSHAAPSVASHAAPSVAKRGVSTALKVGVPAGILAAAGLGYGVHRYNRRHNANKGNR